MRIGIRSTHKVLGSVGSISLYVRKITWPHITGIKELRRGPGTLPLETLDDISKYTVVSINDNAIPPVRKKNRYNNIKKSHLCLPTSV